jgi:hypothetical protein
VCLTGTGKIRVTDSEPYATAQAAANECRRFVGDSYFDHDIGIPHYRVELGRPPTDAVLRAQVRKAALRVNDVAAVLSVELDGFDRETRTLTGRVSFTTRSGVNMAITI